MTGYLTDSELGVLYKNARLYVFPSLIEGFGLPPLEAQSYGLPVASSQATCLPEILNDSAIYFDPEDLNDMVGVIRATLNDNGLRERLKLKGRENIKKYSWGKCAEETLAGYEMVMSNE